MGVCKGHESFGKNENTLQLKTAEKFGTLWEGATQNNKAVDFDSSVKKGTKREWEGAWKVKIAEAATENKNT